MWCALVTAALAFGGRGLGGARGRGTPLASPAASAETLSSVGKGSRHAAVRLQKLAEKEETEQSQLEPEALSGVSRQIRDIRQQMEADEKTAALMSALRGSNINDDDSAAAGTTMRVVEVRRGEGDDVLPTDYEPVALARYFGRRPGAVLTRLFQVAVASSGWIASVAFDYLRGDFSAGSAGEVAATARPRSTRASRRPS